MAIEIQNPFGNDYSDLPLDTFCTIVFNSIRLMTPRSGPGACYNKDFEKALHVEAEQRSELELYKGKMALQRHRSKLRRKKRAKMHKHKKKHHRAASYVTTVFTDDHMSSSQDDDGGDGD